MFWKEAVHEQQEADAPPMGKTYFAASSEDEKAEQDEKRGSHEARQGQEQVFRGRTS